jgi:hypothetical protein
MENNVISFKRGFSLKLKAKRIRPYRLEEVEIYLGSLYKCKLSNQNFRGSCPIHACHANIKNIHPSRCLYLVFPEKDEFDKMDMMYSLSVGEKKMREMITRGRTKVHCAMILFNILTRLRENNRIKFNCPKCGVLRHTSGICINTTQCQVRENFGKHLLENSYLKIPEMRSNLNDVFLLLNNRDKIKEFIDQLDENSYQANLTEIFGTTTEIMDNFLEIKSCI